MAEPDQQAPSTTEQRSAAELLAGSFARSVRPFWSDALFDGYVHAMGSFNAVRSDGESLLAHGMAKFHPVQLTRDLLAIFRSEPGKFGEDQAGGHRRRYLDTAPLTVDTEPGQLGRTADGAAYRHGAYILVARQGGDTIADVNDIAGVLVNQAMVNHAPEIVQALQREAPPHVMVRGYADVADVVRYARTGEPKPNLDDPKIASPTILRVEAAETPEDRARLAAFYGAPPAEPGPAMPPPPAEIVLNAAQLPPRKLPVDVLPGVGADFVDEVQARVADTAPAVLDRLAAGGWRLRVSKYAVNDPGAVGKVDAPNSRAVLAVDMHPDSPKVIDIFEYNSNAGGMAETAERAIYRSILDPDKFAHDLGHALDREFGYPSDGKTFGGAHFADTGALGPEICGQYAYFTQGNRARRETWAEVFAVLERGQKQSVFAQTDFPQSTAAVAEALDGGLGPDWARKPETGVVAVKAVPMAESRRSPQGAWNRAPG